MKNCHEILRWFIPLTAIFILIICAGIYVEKPATEKVIAFQLQSDDSMETVTAWTNKNGDKYLFLPSYAELNNVKVLLPSKTTVTLDGEELNNGDKLDGMSLNAAHQMTVTYGHTVEQYRFFAVKSENVAAVFIETATGNTDNLFTKTDYKETVDISLYSNSGTLDYSGSRDTIKLHGHSTKSLPKKPFSIKLADEADLLNMGAAKSWILLANAYDETELRNKLVFNYAQKVFKGWTPESEYVDLYINGEYEGLYLLAEKIETGDNRFPDENRSIFIATIDDSARWDDDTIGFALNSGREMKLASPANCSQSELEEFEDKMQSAENAVTGGTPNPDLSSQIDLESWAGRYLIDEMFLNVDADKFSSYYYWDSSDAGNKVFAGPIWDYDLSMGNQNSKWSKLHVSPNQIIGCIGAWYSALTDNDEFKAYLKNMYWSDYRPALCELIEQDIDKQYIQIQAAAYSDSVRWSDGLPWMKGDKDEAKDALKSFLYERMAVLDELWSENAEHCIVRFKIQNMGNCCYAVKKDSLISAMPDVEKLGIENFKEWYDEAAGCEFDASQPISEDKTVCAVLEETETALNQQSEKSLRQFIGNHERLIICAVSAAGLVMLAVLLAYEDKKRNGKSERTVQK